MKKNLLQIIGVMLLVLSFSASSCTKKSSDHSLEKAKDLISRDQLKEAKTMLEVLVKESPRNERIRYHYGWVLLYMGNKDMALTQFAKAIKLAPKYHGGYKGYGALYLFQNNLEEAEKSFEKALSLKPDDAAVLSNLSQVKFLNGKKKEANELLLKAIDLKKDYGDYYLLLAKQRLRAQDIKEAKQYLTASKSKPFQKTPLKIQLDCVEGALIGLRIEHDTKVVKETTASMIKTPGKINAEQKKELLHAQNLLNKCQDADPKRFRFDEDKGRVSFLLLKAEQS